MHCRWYCADGFWVELVVGVMRVTVVLCIMLLLCVGTALWWLVECNFLVYWWLWVVFVFGFVELVFYLFSIGVGVAAFVIGFCFVDGWVVDYIDFVVLVMLVMLVMNGVVIDLMYNIFFKLKFFK